MYCSFCGKETAKGDIFCVKCGKKLPVSTNNDNDKSDTCFLISKCEVPQDVNNPLAILMDCGRDSPTDRRLSIDALPLFKEKLPNGDEIEIDWLSIRFHLIITASAIIFVAGSPPSKIYKVTEEIGMLAIAAGSLAGAILVAAPLALFAETYEQLFIGKNKLDHESLCRLFDNGMAGYFMRDQLQLRYIEIKGGIFGESGNMFEISGPFITNIGKIDASITLSDSVLAMVSSAKKVLKKTGFSLDKNKTTAKSLIDALKVIGHLPADFKM